jgi:hypothetical protein
MWRFFLGFFGTAALIAFIFDQTGIKDVPAWVGVPLFLLCYVMGCLPEFLAEQKKEKEQQEAERKQTELELNKHLLTLQFLRQHGCEIRPDAVRKPEDNPKPSPSVEN